MKLELFHFVKLAEDIQNEQVKKLKDSRESKGFSTEEIDIMQYFKIFIIEIYHLIKFLQYK